MPLRNRTPSKHAYLMNVLTAHVLIHTPPAAATSARRAPLATNPGRDGLEMNSFPPAAGRLPSSGLGEEDGAWKTIRGTGFVD